MTVPMALAVLVVRACSLADGVFWLSGESRVGLCWGGRRRAPEGVWPSAPLCWFPGPNPEKVSDGLVKLCVCILGCTMALVGPMTTVRPGLMGGPEVSPDHTEGSYPTLSALFLIMAKAGWTEVVL